MTGSAPGLWCLSHRSQSQGRRLREPRSQPRCAVNHVGVKGELVSGVPSRLGEGSSGPSGCTPGGCEVTWTGSRGWPASRHHQGAQHLLGVPWTQSREPGEVRARGWWSGGTRHRGRTPSCPLPRWGRGAPGPERRPLPAGPRRDEGGPHEADPVRHQGAEPRRPRCRRRRGLASAFSACVPRAPRD